METLGGALTYSVLPASTNMKATLGGQAKDLEPDAHHMSVIGGVLDSPRSSWMGSFIAQIKRALAYLPMGETERPYKAW